MTFLPFSLFLSVTKLSCFLFRFHNARRLFAFPCYPLDLSLSLHHALSLLFSPGGLSQVICLYYSAAKKKGRRSSERESHYLYKVLHTHPSVGGSRVTRWTNVYTCSCSGSPLHTTLHFPIANGGVALLIFVPDNYSNPVTYYLSQSTCDLQMYRVMKTENSKLRKSTVMKCTTVYRKKCFSRGGKSSIYPRDE